MSDQDNSPTPSPKTAILQARMNTQFQALRREMEEMRIQVERRLNRESSDDEGEGRRNRRGRRDDSQEEGSHSDRRNRRGWRDDRRRNRRGRREESQERGGDRRRVDRFDGVKLKVPSFLGLNDPEAYLEWELKMEQFFDCHQYSEYRKVKVAALEFREYAIVWWDQFQKDRRRSGDEVVDTWEEMKVVMRKRFVPRSYQRDVHNKLQRLTQGSKTVDEYFKEMEMALLRSNFHESREATMARFLHGLNPEIQDIVELQPYVEMDDLVQKAMKVEQQIKRRKSKTSSSSAFKYPSSSSNAWKDRSKKEGGSQAKDDAGAAKNPTKPIVDSSQKSRDIKCFKCLGHGHIASQCPTRRTMVVLNGVIESQSEASSEESGEEDEAGSEAVMPMPDGELLMMRRFVGSPLMEQEDSPRNSIFRARCLIKGKVCCMIIDGGSCVDIVSTRVVNKLYLQTQAHPTPYKLQWLNDDGEILVDQQAEVKFSIGNYEDVVLCDVVNMDTCHILLGRPWQYDKRAIHDGFSNKISFVHNNQSNVLLPLTPEQALRDKQ